MVYTRSRVFSVAIGYSFSLVSRLQLPIASLFLANFAFAQASCTSCTQGLIALSEEALSPDRLAIIDIDHGNSANYSSGPTQLYTLVGEPHFNSNRGRFQVLDESGAVVLARSGSQAGSQISQRGTQEGAAVLAGADFNGDGIQDLIVGAPGDDVNGTLDNDAGAVYVYYGAASPSGVSNTPDRVLSIPGAPVNAHLGETLATTTLRSGQQVLLVGAPDRHSVEVFDFRTGRHRATVCAHDSFANTNFYGYSMVAHPTRSGLIYIGGPSDALGGKIELVDLNVADGTAGMACLIPNLPSRGAPCGTPGNSCIASINLLQAKIAMGLTPSTVGDLGLSLDARVNPLTGGVEVLSGSPSMIAPPSTSPVGYQYPGGVQTGGAIAFVETLSPLFDMNGNGVAVYGLNQGYTAGTDVAIFRSPNAGLAGIVAAPNGDYIGNDTGQTALFDFTRAQYTHIAGNTKQDAKMRRIDVRADRSQSGYENMAIGGVGKALSNGMQENFQEFKLADTTIQATSGTFLQENGGCNLAMPGVAPPVASLTSTQNPTTGDLTVSFTITGIPTTAVTASGVIPLGQRIARIIIGDVVPGPPFVFSQAHPNNPTIVETCKYYQALNTGQVGQILGVVEIQVPAGQSTATSSITFADPGAVGAGGLTASFSANILTVNPPPGLQANTGALTHLYLGVL